MNLRRAVKDLTPATLKMVDGAPVAEKSATPNAKLRGQMVQITVTMTPSDLEKVSEAAKKSRVSRTGFIRQAIFEKVEQQT